jgi:PhnB protein
MPTRRKPRTARRRRTKPKPRIPAGFHTITPYLAVVGGAAAMEFYKKAFGARELLRQLTPDGKLIHGRLKIGDSMLFLSDVFQGSDRTAPSTLETTTVALHVYTTDVETLWNRAVAAGATVTMPLEDQFWGERYGHLRDPFGHHWSLSMPIRMSRKEREEKRRAAMAMFDRGEHPSHEPPESDA